jgi:hypothetical protein
MEEKKRKAITKKKNGTLSLGATQFKKALTEQKEKRNLIKDFIKEQMVEGTDYGKIDMKGRLSKPCLFKPGAEKFCELLQLQSTFERDNEILENLAEAQKQDTIAFICRIMKNDKIIGEGRGACTLSEKGGNINVAIKIAEKRAHIDAVIRNPIIGLSDIFTQDLEDLPANKEEKPTLDTIITIGKNKGKKMGEAPLSWLEWYRDKVSTHPEWIQELINQLRDKKIEENKDIQQLYDCVKGLKGMTMEKMRKAIKARYDKNIETDLTATEIHDLISYLKSVPVEEIPF